MIRAGRRHLVRTLADIAAQQGIAVPTLLSSARLQAPGFPAPLSAGRTRLYDGEQVDAYLAGRPRRLSCRPCQHKRLVPGIPAAGDEAS
jgi:hypothetical protein